MMFESGQCTKEEFTEAFKAADEILGLIGEKLEPHISRGSDGVIGSVYWRHGDTTVLAQYLPFTPKENFTIMDGDYLNKIIYADVTK